MLVGGPIWHVTPRAAGQLGFGPLRTNDSIGVARKMSSCRGRSTKTVGDIGLLLRFGIILMCDTKVLLIRLPEHKNLSSEVNGTKPSQ